MIPWKASPKNMFQLFNLFGWSVQQFTECCIEPSRRGKSAGKRWEWSFCESGRVVRWRRTDRPARFCSGHLGSNIWSILRTENSQNCYIVPLNQLLWLTHWATESGLICHSSLFQPHLSFFTNQKQQLVSRFNFDLYCWNNEWCLIVNQFFAFETSISVINLQAQPFDIIILISCKISLKRRK